jgi:hypothetical protein
MVARRIRICRRNVPPLQPSRGMGTGGEGVLGGMGLKGEFLSSDTSAGREQYPNIVIDYNSIPYFHEFVNIISWIFWKQAQINFKFKGLRPIAILKSRAPLRGFGFGVMVLPEAEHRILVKIFVIRAL